MLNVIISDSAKNSMMRLSDMVKAIIKAAGADADIKFITLDQRGLWKAPVEENDPCLFILEFHAKNIPLYQKIRETYSDSTLLFFSSTINEAVLKASLSGNIRPSGLMEKPVQLRELQGSFMDIYATYANRAPELSEKISIASEGRIYRILPKNIIYFEAIGKKITFVTKNQSASYYDSLLRIENTYPDLFIRCHKSFLVNIQKIQEIWLREMVLIMNNQAKIPLSRTYKNKVKETLHLMPKNTPVISKN